MSKSAQCAKDKSYLEAELGGRCARCSVTENLEFDCITPRGKDHHGMSKCDRIRFYVSEFHKGNLQLLCNSCHQLKSAQDKVNLQNLKAAVVLANDHTNGVQVPNRGPEPSVSDWAAWCRWHRGEPPLETK